MSLRSVSQKCCSGVSIRVLLGSVLLGSSAQKFRSEVLLGSVYQRISYCSEASLQRIAQRSEICVEMSIAGEMWLRSVAHRCFQKCRSGAPLSVAQKCCSECRSEVSLGGRSFDQKCRSEVSIRSEVPLRRARVSLTYIAHCSDVSLRGIAEICVQMSLESSLRSAAQKCR